MTQRRCLIALGAALALLGAQRASAQVDVESCRLDARSSIHIEIIDFGAQEALGFRPPYTNLVAHFQTPGRWRIDGAADVDPARLAIDRSDHALDRVRLRYATQDGVCMASLLFRATPTWQLYVTASGELKVQQHIVPEGPVLVEGATPFDSRPLKRTDPAYFTIWTAPTLRFTRTVKFAELDAATERRLQFDADAVKGFLCAEQSNKLRCRRLFRSLTHTAKVPSSVSFTLRGRL